MSGCANVNGYLYMHMRNFIAKIEELQVNRKGANKEKDSEFLAAKEIELFSVCFHKNFLHVKAAIYLEKWLDVRCLKSFQMVIGSILLI